MEQLLYFYSKNLSCNIFSMEELARDLKKRREEGIVSVLEEVNKAVTPCVEELLEEHVEKEFRDVVKYQITTGGKRIRASLVLLSCLSLGGKVEDAIYPAAAMEILHNDTLMIDDIIDNSVHRRGEWTAWKKYGTSITQCLSFIYSASAFQAVKYSGDPKELADMFSQVLKSVSQGEVSDILLEQAGREEEDHVQKNRYLNPGVGDYLRMVSLKTAYFLQIAAEMGGRCAQGSVTHLESLRGYGYNLGVSFQIRDDILDIYGKETKFGKKIGQDIREGKLGNILMMYALEEMDKKEKERSMRILRKKEKTEKEAEDVMEMIKSTNAKKRATQLANEYTKKGYDSLQGLTENEYTSMLADLLDFVSIREV